MERKAARGKAVIDPIGEAENELRSYSGDDEGQEWRLLAACRKADPELFFSANGETKTAYERRYREGRASYCASCLVRVACLKYAVENGESFGLWGGVYGEDLKQLIKRRNRKRVY
jgi:WhiB family redox-sensing transcriptional regulator